MRIAICDDNREIAEWFCEKIQSAASEANISIFTNGNDLIKSEYPYDIAFLDIEMEGLNGFSVAKILKENHPKCIFSFITTHAELAIDGYDYQPFRYILKTAPEPVIKRKIQETLQEYSKQSKCLNVAYKGIQRAVLISDIYLIEIKGHCMNIILDNDEILWNKPLNDIEKELKQYGLIRCHRSFIVALSHIKELSSKEIKMKNGSYIPIGRMYKDTFLKEYNKFIIG